MKGSNVTIPRSLFYYTLSAIILFSHPNNAFFLHTTPTKLMTAKPASPPSAFHQRHTRSRQIIPKSSLQMNIDPSELAQQKFDSARSIADYHDGSWTGTATSFSISTDVAAGVSRRKTVQYQTSVATQLDSDGIKILETFQFDENKVFSRIVPLSSESTDASVDVDSVDGSYSLDAPLLDLPSGISGTGVMVKFGMEHCLAASDEERVRLFLLYGVDDRLVRVLLCEERREKREDATSDDVALQAAAGDGRTSKEIIQNIKAGATPEEKMDRLMQAMAAAKEPSDEKKKNSVILPNPMSVVSLVSGVWLGDAVVRNHPKTDPQNNESYKSKGFGSKSSSSYKPPKPGAGMQSGFAEWTTGIQKIALTFLWDYSKTIRQRIDLGRSMGSTATSADFPPISTGTIVVNDSSRRKKVEERMVYIDFDMGSYAAFVVGNVYVKAPRSISFSHARDEMKPFYTEFAVFQKRMPEDKGDDTSSTEKPTPPEVFCSRMTRLYGTDGKLCQGSTAFFTQDRSMLDRLNNDDDDSGVDIY